MSARTGSAPAAQAAAMPPPVPDRKFGIGQPVLRVEDRRFLTGRGRYVDDIVLPRMCHGAVVMSTHAFARILRIDCDAARAAPGVLCVLTGVEMAADGLGGLPPLFMPVDLGGPPGYGTLRPPLVRDTVRCVGDRVAFVVAETDAQARDAAALVEVEYETFAPAILPEDAVGRGARRLWEECADNVSFDLRFGDEAATAAVFSRAAHIVSLKLENNRISANSLEPRAAVGDYSPADEAYTLYSSSQNPHGARLQLARDVFHIAETRLRVIAPDVGGGFGMKADPYPEEALVLWASRRCGRPVKWVATRSESLSGDNHGRDQFVKAEMALDEQGRILALRADALHAVGAYIVSAAVAPVRIALLLVPSVYDVDTVDLRTRAVFTNTSPLGPYRGAGRPEAIYVTERLLDLAAVELGVDPVEIRRRNFIKPAAMPHRTPTGLTYDSGEFEAIMERCLDLADWDGFAGRSAASTTRGLLRGRAVNCYVEQSGVFNERMDLRFDPGGAVTIVAGTLSHGQGHATTYAQMASEWLGIPFETIGFVQGDTEKVVIGRGTYAARSSLAGGCALRAAVDNALVKARAMAASLLETDAGDLVFREGRFEVGGTDRAVSITEVVKAFFRSSHQKAEFGVGLDASGFYTDDAHTFPNGCHVCEVEVDPDTGAVAIVRYCAVDDIGTVINPMICEGQMHGGLAQGIGQALLEKIVYDPRSGQLISGSFTDYCMPRANDCPPFRQAFRNVPSTGNPLGIKGLGESGTVVPPSLIINAILHALRPLGVGQLDMPATPERVWSSIRAAQSRVET